MLGLFIIFKNGLLTIDMQYQEIMEKHGETK